MSMKDDNKPIHLGFPKKEVDPCGCGGQPVEIEGGLFCFQCCSPVRLPEDQENEVKSKSYE